MRATRSTAITVGHARREAYCKINLKKNLLKALYDLKLSTFAWMGVQNK